MPTLKRLKQGDENELEKKIRLEKVVVANSSGWPWRQKKKEEQDWRMMQLPNDSGWSWRQMKKENKTGEDGNYHTAQVGPGDGGRKKSKKRIGI